MKQEAPARADRPAPERTGSVIALPLPESDDALVASLRTGHPRARAALFERHAGHVRRVLIRVLGLDQEIPDLLQEVFLAALTQIHRIDDPAALKAWLTSVAVHQARSLIRKRSRRRILRFVDPTDLHGEPAPSSGAVHHEVVRALYRVLDSMPADERIVFALRFVDGMELVELAAACKVSRATICRRLERAERRFVEVARKDEALAAWLEKGSRWNA